ncbi:glycosyltransferase [Rhizobium binxianense]
MDVVLIVASARGEMCGVTDYADRLAAALQKIGATARVEFFDQWSFANFRALRRRCRNHPNTVFHMQYPTLRLGRSVSPGSVPLLLPNAFVTLHEFRLFNILRKAAFFPASLLAKRVIFSNDEEKALFQNYFPHAKSRLCVIPIGNNIIQLAPRGIAAQRERLVYFGQISRNKGIEFFLETVARLRAAGAPIEAEIIGAMVDNDPAFVSLVKSSAERDTIRLRLNMPADRVSAALNDATIALLPFPDGISNKRGSALASLDHGITVLTTHSEVTPDWMAKVTHPVSSPENAAALVGRIMSGDVERLLAPDIRARELGRRNWNEIAREHLRLYQEGLGKAS